MSQFPCISGSFDLFFLAIRLLPLKVQLETMQKSEADDAGSPEEAPRKGLRRRILESLGISFLTTFQRFTLATSRLRVINGEAVQGLLAANRPFILAIWHCNVYLSPILYRGMDVYVLISKSKDGDLIDRVVHAFGNRSIRGSTSRGGPSALKAMIRVARQNSRLAFTPDGPRGPAFKVQPGIIAAASACGIPILPVHYESTRQKIARSWDSHRVPLPFGTIVHAYGQPIEIERELTEEQFEAERERVQQALLENMKDAIAARDALLKG